MELYNLKYNTENIKYKNYNLLKILIILSLLLFIIIIILLLIIFNFNSIINKFIFYYKDLKNFMENNLKILNNNKSDMNFDINDYILKTRYNKDINFYKEILKLYIENKTEFKIRGRQHIMEICGRIYNDSNISTIQDKLNWILIHDNPEYKSKMTDKILLHEYSKKILGKDICVPILKVYNSSKEINLDELPEKFVLKCNHGCGMNILCNNKSNLDLMNAKNKLDEWLNINYGLKTLEYQYINIQRKIFAEKYLIDYKVYCFNGEPKFIRVQQNLPDNITKVNNYYNLDWTLNEIETGLGSRYVRRPDIIFEKPKNLDLMIEYAKKLSAEFIFVRVDLYELNETIYLGEMTFSPSNILFNCKDMNQSLYLGSLLDISKKNNN